MTTKEAAKYIGVSLRTFQKMTKAHVIPVQRITTRKHLIRQFDLDRYLEDVTS